MTRGQLGSLSLSNDGADDSLCRQVGAMTVDCLHMDVFLTRSTPYIRKNVRQQFRSRLQELRTGRLPRATVSTATKMNRRRGQKLLRERMDVEVAPCFHDMGMS